MVLPENFPHGEEIKAVKSDFTRVGKAIRAIYKVISEIIKCARLTGTISSQDEVKINSLEDKVTAALGEVQKANEKKASLLKKKIAQETEAEKRLKRKEELAATKATKTLDDEHSKKRSSADCSEEIEKGDSTNVVPKKKLKSLGEKALKEMATLEKQKSMLMSFFTSPTSKAKKPANDCSPSGPLLCASVGDSPEDRVDAPSLEPSAPRVNVEKIDQYFKTPLTMAEIYAANKNRYTSSIDLRYHKSFRKPKTLSVTVTSSSEGAWESGANYAEIKDIRVDSRKRLFSFAEDFRPPY